MSVILEKYDKQTKELNSKEVVEKSEMNNAIAVSQKVTYDFDIYNEFNKLTDPKEGLKKVWGRIKTDGLTICNLRLKAGSQFSVFVQKADELYGSAIIFGYGTSTIMYMRMVNGVWS